MAEIHPLQSSQIASEQGRPINRACRWLVLGSRVIGLAACLPSLVFDLTPTGPGLGSDMLMSATLVLCYLLWIWADYQLLEDAG